MAICAMEWVQRLPVEDRCHTVKALATALLDPITFARMGVPKGSSKVRATAGRKRAPGRGRPPAYARHVLAGDVRRAMLAAGIKPGRWRIAGKGAADGEMNSPFFVVLAFCWELATETAEKPGIKLHDLRRMGAGLNKWHLMPKLSRPMTWTERQWLWGLIS